MDELFSTPQILTPHKKKKKKKKMQNFKNGVTYLKTN
jgi:hypothetical protein